ncbi:pyoverdine dityrosine biosynthesis [Fusarium longipes]|uniref:Pyoverdine dityrosine biosynthesis n=1 Tax=Fusarium longipes TaxID=694270 RepID=A0A395RNS1_9HYPO|nr:pyoverdine dityrosine biosynthesis [Fusarium longipes]
MFEVRSVFAQKAEKSASVTVNEIEVFEEQDNAPVDGYITKLADTILDVVQTYGMHTKTTEDGAESVEQWEGRSKFRTHIEYWIRRREPINFVIPSYPFKSENPDKVTGSLPDMGEYIGLYKLHSMTLDVGQVYPFGAQVTVASDGAVFNDIYPTSDEKVWEYSQAIDRMAKKYGLNVRISSPHELMGVPTVPLDKESYIEGLHNCRAQIEKYTKPELLDDLFARDPDSLRTYTQMSRFYEIDLKYTPIMQGLSRMQGKKITKKLARATMARSEAFTGLVLRALPHHVRLSVHASTGAVKLSFPLVPQGGSQASVFRVPWMSSISVNKAGEFESVYSGDVRDTHDLVFKDGQPWCYRERSDLFNFVGKDIVLDHIYPRGLLVTSEAGKESVTMADEDVERVKSLAQLQPVHVYGFSNLQEGLLQL